MMNISALVSALPDAPNALVLAFIGIKKSPPNERTNGWRTTDSSIPEEKWNSTEESWVDYSHRRTKQFERWDTAYDVLEEGWNHIRDIHIATILKNFQTKKLGEVKDILKKLLLGTPIHAFMAQQFKLNSMANFMYCLEKNLKSYGHYRTHILLMLLASQKPSPTKTPKAKTSRAKTPKAPESDCFALVRQNSVCDVRVLAVTQNTSANLNASSPCVFVASA